MGSVAMLFSAGREVGNARLVQLAQAIRKPGVNGFVSPNFLREFDTLATGKKFGLWLYQGEALKLITAQGAEYYRQYGILSAMCDSIVRENLLHAA